MRDHPRSRGVYRGFERALGARSGSSPLARGLPVLDDRVLGGRRIIPARAGFTDIDAGDTTTLGDHPRSRGVYPTTT